MISTRLAGFGGGGLLPHSWQGRIDNLTHFYLPQLAGFHWVLGVRPDTVLPAPETWRDVIYLESGYLWLFWVGGDPARAARSCGSCATGSATPSESPASASHDDIGVAALATPRRAVVPR